LKNIKEGKNKMFGFSAKGYLQVQDENASKKSFFVNVKCTSKALVISNGVVQSTNITVNSERNYNRLAGKNLTKDIKNFICPIAGVKQSSLVRKRLIGLQKIHKTISNETFNFSING
jgi:hypothetical protein